MDADLTRSSRARRHTDRQRLASAGGRPDRLALWAVLLALLAALAAATSAKGQASGGMTAPGSAPANVQLGDRTLSPGASGADVLTLQEILRAKRFGGNVNGVYDDDTVSAERAFERAASLQPDGVFTPDDKSVLVGRMRARSATWYGPGFYGKQTACGITLTPDTIGVAHKSLPCGTPVTFYYQGRFLTAKVIDRGPYNGDYSWDLTAAAAQQLGFEQSDYVRSVHFRGDASSARHH